MYVTATELLAEEGDINIYTESALTAEATIMQAGANIDIYGDSVTFSAVAKDEYANMTESNWSVGFSVPSFDLERGSGALTGRAGTKFSGSSQAMSTKIHQGATLAAANNINILAENDISLENITVMAENDINVAAGGNVDIFESTNTTDFSSTSYSGFVGINYSATNSVVSQGTSLISTLNNLPDEIDATIKAINGVDDPFEAVRVAAQVTTLGLKVQSLPDAAKKFGDELKASIEGLVSNDPKKNAAVNLLNFDISAEFSLEEESIFCK